MILGAAVVVVAVPAKLGQEVGVAEFIGAGCIQVGPDFGVVDGFDFAPVRDVVRRRQLLTSHTSIRLDRRLL